MSDQDEPVGPDSFGGEDFPSVEPHPEAVKAAERTLDLESATFPPEEPSEPAPPPPAPPPPPKPTVVDHKAPAIKPRAHWVCSDCGKVWKAQPISTKHMHTERLGTGGVRYTQHPITRVAL